MRLLRVLASRTATPERAVERTRSGCSEPDLAQVVRTVQAQGPPILLDVPGCGGSRRHSGGDSCLRSPFRVGAKMLIAVHGRYRSYAPNGTTRRGVRSPCVAWTGSA